MPLYTLTTHTSLGVLNARIMVEKIGITKAASAVIEILKDRFGPLMFHQSGGCCDGSAPMCFEKGDFKVGETDVLLGKIDECPFYIAHDQYQYWKHTHLTLDVTNGRGSSFSLEIPMGVRFIIHSRLFTDNEREQLREEGIL